MSAASQPKVCTTVFGFGGGQAILDRHLPLWRAVSDEVLLVYPTDSPNTGAGARHLPTGLSNKYGEECIKRQLHGMVSSLEAEADYYVFLEYDAFLLARPRPRAGLQANVFPNDDARYAAKHYFHFPWIFDRDSLRRFAGAASMAPLENGFVDRWLARQVEPLALPLHDLQKSGEGFSRNTIRLWGERREALRRARAGAYAFHGIKDARLLSKLVDAHKASGRASLWTFFNRRKLPGRASETAADPR